VGVSGGAAQEITSVFVSTGTPGEALTCRTFSRIGRPLSRGPGWPDGPARRRHIVARRRPAANTVSYFMDYGPDWPPPPRPPSARRALLRRCMAVVVLYAVIWAMGSALLELRLLELRKLTGTPVTTYTTITGTPHHDRR
jgi:hypothetical protein